MKPFVALVGRDTGWTTAPDAHVSGRFDPIFRAFTSFWVRTGDNSQGVTAVVAERPLGAREFNDNTEVEAETRRELADFGYR